MSIKRYFQNFVDSGVYLTVVFETACPGRSDKDSYGQWENP
jgi:hypothetical protein